MKRFIAMILAAVIICLCQISQATAARAEESVPVTIVDFPVNINYELYNLPYSGYNKMEYCEYPMIAYKGITYFPLTYYNCNLIGVTLELRDGQAFINKADFTEPMPYFSDQSDEAPDNPLYAQKAPFTVNVNGAVYDDVNYPFLFYKNIVYLPLTWTVVHDIMGWSYYFGDWSDTVRVEEEAIKLFTDSYYYYSSGDSFFEITEENLGATVAPGKTYWGKNGVRVYAEIEHINMIGPNRSNLIIIKDGVEKTVPGYSCHGQKKGPLFTVDGEYIYTVHYPGGNDPDTGKFITNGGPCKISIETGEVTYLN